MTKNILFLSLLLLFALSANAQETLSISIPAQDTTINYEETYVKSKGAIYMISGSITILPVDSLFLIRKETQMEEREARYELYKQQLIDRKKEIQRLRKETAQ